MSRAMAEAIGPGGGRKACSETLRAGRDVRRVGTGDRNRAPWAEDGPWRGRGQPPTREGITPYLTSSGLQLSPVNPGLAPSAARRPVTQDDRLDVASGRLGEAALDRVVAAELEEHRVYHGFATLGRQITQSELAEHTSMSKDHIGKMLRGQRPVYVRTLGALAAPLGLPAEVYDHLRELILRNEDPAQTVPDSGPPPAHMREVLAALQYPAMLLTPGLFDVHVLNEAAIQILPRLDEAGNLLRWLFCDPIARTVFAGDTWHLVATVCSYALHYLSRGIVPEPARANLIAELSKAPEFARMWAARIEGALFPLRVAIADPNQPSQIGTMTLTASTPWRAPANHLQVSLIPCK